MKLLRNAYRIYKSSVNFTMTKIPYAGKEKQVRSGKHDLKQQVAANVGVRKLDKRLKKTKGEAEPSVGLGKRVRIIRMPSVAGKNYDIVVRND